MKTSSYALSSALPEDVSRHLRKTTVMLVLVFLMALAFPYPPTKFAIAGILGLYILTNLGRQPEAVLAVLILFLPVYSLFPQDLLPVRGFNVQTVIAIIAIVGALGLRRSRPAPVPLSGFFWCLLALVSVALVQSFLYSPQPMARSLTITKNWLGYMPFFFFSSRVCHSSWARKMVIVALLVAAFLTAAESNYRYLESGGGTRVRSQGLIGAQPNVYGGYLAFILPLFVALAINGTSKRRDWLLLSGGTLMVAAALIFTKSRGAWIGFAAGLVVMILFRRQVKLALLVLLLAVFAGSILPEAFFDRIEQTFDTSDTGETIVDKSTGTRFTQWRTLPEFLSERPFIGHGLFTYGEMVYQRGIFWRRMPPHSTIIRFGVEFGLVGLFFYFFLFARFLLASRKLAGNAEDPFEQALFTGLIGSFAALVVSDASGTRFFSSQIFAVFCILAGVVSGRLADTGRPASEKQDALLPPSTHALDKTHS